MRNFLLKNYDKLSVAFSIAAAFTYLLGVSLAGGKLWQVPVFIISICLYIVLPGYLIQRLFTKEEIHGVFNPKSVTYGMGYFVTCYIISTMAGSVILLKLSAILGLIGTYYAKKDKRPVLAKSKTRYIIPIYFWIIFVFTFLAVAKRAHPAKVGQLLLSQDFMWTVGNRESFKIDFPPTDIRYVGITLKYHYLTEMAAGALSIVTGISRYDTVAFYMQLFIAMFLLAALFEFGTEYYGEEKKALLFVLSFFTLGCLSLWKAIPGGRSLFGNSLTETLISNINSQATAFAFLSVFATSLLKISKADRLQMFDFLTAVLSFVMVIFSKSPIGAICAIALVCRLAVAVIGKNTDCKTAVTAAVVTGIFALVYFGYLSAGAEKSTVFTYGKTLESGYFKNYLALFRAKSRTLYLLSVPVFMILQSFCVAPFQLLTVVPKAFKDLFRLFKLDFFKLWCYACGIGGLLAFFIVWHEAYSQVYFLYAAIFFLNLLAVEYFDFSKPGIKNALQYLFMGLSICTALCLYINFCGSGLRQYLFHYNILPKYDYKYCVKSEDELAGLYLRENMAGDELFITNRTHTGAGEGLSNVYTCFSGRQSYMEGWKYTMSNMGVSWEEVAPRVENVGKIFGQYGQEPVSAKQILDICRGIGVKYAVYSSQFDGDNTNIECFEKVFVTGTVTIYKIY